MTDGFHTRSVRKLLGGHASALALAVACAATPAQAQTGAQGTGTVVLGTATINSGSNTDTIQVQTQHTVINWQPNDVSGTGTIDFLPAGHTMVFNTATSSVLSDYTVLNRILPTHAGGLPVSRVIALNGTVQSQSNGSVWFYSPGGIIAGPTSVFNVGSLVLTTNDIDFTGGLLGSNGEIRFRGQPGSTSAVEVQAGATINALTPGTYVALVAPRVVQGGTVNVGGSAAYVAAEAADIKINGGLFDITITAGTTDANGVVHIGDTNGGLASGGGEARRIYMVAVPKNNALTMLLSGNVGYVPAGVAIPDDKGVVLSAGYDVAGGAIAATRNATATTDSGFTIGWGNWQSTLTGAATGNIAIASAFSPGVNFTDNVTLSAERGITLRADQFGSINASGDMTLNAGFGANGGRIDVTSVGGTGSANNDGRITIAGGLTLNASGDGDAGVMNTPLTGANATGGTISVIANGGEISATSLYAAATANGGYGTDSSGNATGGAITLSALTAAGPLGAEGGVLRFGFTNLDASASVAGQYPAAVNGGSAIGGSIALAGTADANGVGGLDLGSLYAVAGATGGNASTGTAGSATGGNIGIAIAGGAHQWSGLNADVSTVAGFASDGGNYGAASPGASGITIDIGGPGSLTVHGSVSLHADAQIYGPGASGGALRAGSIGVLAHDGGSFTVDGDLSLGATARAYNSGYPGGPAGGTPDLFGGAISIGAAGGTFTSPGLRADASAYGPGESMGGIGLSGVSTGGSVTLYASSSGGTRGNLTLSDCLGFGCTVLAIGQGGTGPSGSNGVGGAIQLYASDADFSALGNLTLSANGNGGGGSFGSFGGRSGDGQGGSVTVESRAGSAGDATLAFGVLAISAAGTSNANGYPGNGGGGTGTGGSANLNIAGGSFTADQVTMDVSGLGGAAGANCSSCVGGSSTPFQAGDGRGGTGNFLITGGTATIGALTLGAGGTGGEAYADGASDPVAALAGAGRGGSAILESRGGSLQLGTLSIDASGTGGDGYSTYQNDGSDGGAGIGGSARLLLTAGGNGLVSVDNGIVIGAAGVGGNGAGTYADASGTYRAGNGGSGTGGGVDATLAGGTLTAPSLLVSAGGSGGSGGENGTDGAGGAAGNGIGGTATLAYRNEGHVIGSIAVNASGQGGQAGSTGQIIGYDSNDQPIYAYGIGAGGQGGRGAGGTANVLIDVDPSYGSLTVSADGVGSIGASGGTGGAGGIGAGGTAALNITFGATSVSDALRVTASGDGGMGGSGYYGAGGRGGDAQAGSATLGVAGASASLAAGNIAVLAEARGGAGGIGGLQGVTGLPGAAGGNAIGGTALFAVTGGGSAAPGGALIVSADAIGGAGAAGTAGPSGGAGGAGGNATAGSATLRIADGHLIGGGSGANYLITATGQGGAGADGSAGGNAGLSGGIGGAGGNGTGGTASFDAANGDYALGGLDIVADGLGGTAGAGGAGPGGASAAGAIGAGSGGTASFANSDSGVLASGALRQLESLAMRANGDAAGRVVFADTSSAANGGLRINGALTLTSLGAPVTGFSGIFVSATANPVQIGGDAAFDTDGPLGFAFSGGGGLNAVGALTGRSGTRIDISHNGRPAGADSLVADTISLTAPGDISMSSPGSLRATNGVTISSAGGRIDFATGSMINAGGNVTLTAQGISVAGLTSGGQALLDAGAGSLSVSNLAAANPITAYGQGISLSGPGALAIALANAGTGSLTLNAGSLDATALVATGAVAATTTGNARFGDVTSTSGGITLNAGGVASLSGTISGRTIAIGSSDVVIAATASIGVPGTTTGVTFTSVNTGAPAYIGGGDMAGGYSLSAAEIARVAAGNISIVGSNAGVIVRDLTIGTNVLPGTGVLSISTPGRLSVEGALAMTGRTGQGGLTLSAGDTLAVVAGAGSIDLRDPAGVLGGVLNLRGRTIIAASSAAIADVAAAPTLDARERRLAQNDGSVSDAGIIRAGAINAAAADGLFIQNTGSGTEFADRRGFTANSFAITTTGQTQIAINGRLTGPGGFVIGRDTGPQTSINGVLDGRAGGFFIGSTVNGCLIGTAGACANLDSALASHGILEGELNPAAALPRPLSLSLIELWDVMEQGFPPLIDEPVTGAGNEDLWTQPCGGAGESACSGNATP